MCNICSTTLLNEGKYYKCLLICIDDLLLNTQCNNKKHIIITCLQKMNLHFISIEYIIKLTDKIINKNTDIDILLEIKKLNNRISIFLSTYKPTKKTLKLHDNDDIISVFDSNKILNYDTISLI